MKWPPFPVPYLNIPNFDEVELRRRTELYRHLKYYIQNMDFTMTTKEMQQFQLNLMIELEWPQLVSGRQMLPTIEVNKTHIYEVKLTNPSDNPILIDYTLADPTLAKQTRISLPLEVVVITPSCYLTDKSVFSLVNSPPEKPILIPGLSSVTIPIRFQTDYVGTICTLLHIRNNLTLYEGVWISAKTVQSQFRLGNRKPGSQTPLLFEITEQHLASACPLRDERFKLSDTTSEQYVVPQVISRRVFTARNSGELPIRIEGFWIDDQPCQGYGFQVMDCSSFELLANSSKKIEISFQSDFTVTRITRSLTLKTNLTYDVNYILVAQLPSKGLEQCELLLPRPPWEEKIRNAAIVMLLITFVLVLVAVHIDYGNIIYNQSALYEARDKGTVHPTFNLRNIAMRSTQNNNDSSPSTSETNQKTKTKVNSSERSDNSSSSLMSLKKRNVKNSKAVNGEAKSSASSGRTGMTLAEMVSWTFGTKSSKKAAVNYNKNSKPAEQTNTNVSNATPITNEAKASSKAKFSEKSLIDKMDGDMRKSQISKKSKANDKGQTKQQEKSETEEVKLRKEEHLDKDTKKEKNSPKLQTKTGNSHHSETTKEAREQRKSLELTSQVTTAGVETTDKNQNSPKETTNGRKLGKTPGRERRKQSAQNISPVISDITSSSSTSSSTSSSCSSQHQNTAKRNERKAKVKASNSLKFTHNNNATTMFPSSYSASSSPTSMTANKTENINSHVDILTPWDCGNHATFSDVLQKSQQQQQQQQEHSTSTDLIQQQGSLFDLMSHSPNGLENSEITAALTPKRPKNPVTDLGPIGSRKSPSSTPVWEPIQSAITMQLPRPLNTTSPVTSSSSSSSMYYPMTSNFGYNDLASSTMQQHQQDINAQLLVLQRQILEQQHLQQQQQQYLNSNALNNNWSNLSSPLWSPILGNTSSATNNTNSSSIFSQPPTQNTTWSLSPNSSSPASGLVRPPPGLEQNFSLNNNLSSAAVTSSAASSNFNNTTMATSSQSSTDHDNMPMFNLFGGLSSIWNDNWKQSTASNQQQQQQQQQQSPQFPMINKQFSL
ncbi:Transmembrane protein 131 like protein [Lucilia cuprina]|nr:Transmembrane protein 131 like protein [Lucilia cuprina]